MTKTLDAECLENYRYAHELWKSGDIDAALRYYRKNRAEHGVDLYYEVALPRHVVLVHPVGTVLGRATYGDYFVAYQNVGVGSTLDGSRPVFGEGVVLFPGAKVLGDAVVGSNCFITANTVVQGRTIPDNSIVIGTDIIKTTRSVKAHYFKDCV